jgi:hypothetical protein
MTVQCNPTQPESHIKHVRAFAYLICLHAPHNDLISLKYTNTATVFKG